MGPKIFGLTGGIASGKSTVVKFLHNFGIDTIDLDVVARNVVYPGSTCLREVSQAFPGVLNPDGTLNRGALADIVFTDSTKLGQLNRIMAPHIEEGLDLALHSTYILSRIVCVESAILIESGMTDRYRPLVLVAAPEAAQINRGALRDKSTPEKIQARIQSQLPLEEKRKLADYVIENDSDLATLQKRTEDLVQTLFRKHFPWR